MVARWIQIAVWPACTTKAPMRSSDEATWKSAAPVHALVAEPFSLGAAGKARSVQY